MLFKKKLKYHYKQGDWVIEFDRNGIRCVVCVPEEEVPGLSKSCRRNNSDAWKRVEELYQQQKAAPMPSVPKHEKLTRNKMSLLKDQVAVHSKPNPGKEFPRWALWADWDKRDEEFPTALFFDEYLCKRLKEHFWPTTGGWKKLTAEEIYDLLIS